jgi:hypothetical protein
MNAVSSVYIVLNMPHPLLQYPPLLPIGTDIPPEKQAKKS